MNDVDEIMRCDMWRRGSNSITAPNGAVPLQAWRTPLSRHLKLMSFVEGDNTNEQMSQSVLLMTQGSGTEASTAVHPLHMASSQGIGKLVRALLRVQTNDPSARDGQGKTPLHWAAMTDRVDLMRLLLEHGAEIDAADHCNRTPLFSCAAFGAARAAKLLLERGANKELCCERGLAPIHAAASGGHRDVLELLVDAGADSLKQSSSCGATARHIAQRRGYEDIARLLEKKARGRPSDGDDASGGHGKMQQHSSPFFSKVRSEAFSLTQQPLLREKQ